MDESEQAIKALNEYMAANNMNQTQLSVKLGIATTQVNRWLRSGKISRSWIEILKMKGILK